MFAAKFLRSELGFTPLRQSGWVQRMLTYWKHEGNIEYISRVEQSMYKSLNLNLASSNGQDNDHALQIWIPIYERSSDMRTELHLLKRFPFQLIVKLETP